MFEFLTIITNKLTGNIDILKVQKKIITRGPNKQANSYYDSTS